MKEVNPVQFACDENYSAYEKAVYKTIAQMKNLNPDDVYRQYSGSCAKPGEYVEKIKHIVFRDRYEVYRRMVNGIDRKVADTGTGIWKEMDLNQYICNSQIAPVAECNYRKISGRATKFLLSLGRPDDALILEYRQHLRKLAANGTPVSYLGGEIRGNVYEQMVMLPINGKYEFLYLLASDEHVIYIHHRAPNRGDHEYKVIPFSREMPVANPFANVMTLDETYLCVPNQKDGTVFDIESFLVNLWLTEETQTCSVCPEPSVSRNEFDQTCRIRGVKPRKNLYRYIHITDNTWTKYESAVTRTASSVNYHVPSWYVRAHYASRNGKHVLIRGHYAYRKCDAVDNARMVEYIV